MSQKTVLKPIILEAYSTIDEQAHITGVALIPRISRNDNLYTKAELKRFDNVTVPLNWEHDTSKQIGTVTFHYNAELETVYYDGMITDEASADLARNKTLFTSIEADPVDMKEICNAPDDCFHMPYGLVPVGLALTETPGVPETSVRVIEHYIKECEIDKELEKKYSSSLSQIKTGEQDLYVNTTVGEQGRGEPNDDCIANKIVLIKKEDPDVSQDQAVAMAIAHCTNDEAVKYLAIEFLKLKESFCPDCGNLKKKNR